MFDFRKKDSFISKFLLEKQGLVSYEHDEFKQVKMVSKGEEALGPNVYQWLGNIRICTTKLKTYIIDLETYDIIIEIKWIGAH